MNVLTATAVLLIVAPGFARGAGALDALSGGDKTNALRTALTQSAQAAIANLGVADGFLGNPEVKIALPAKIEKARWLIKAVGLNPQADELVTAMNRAAEAAVPEARALMISAIRQMSITDATEILTGPEDAATQYFRRTTSDALTARFSPIIGKATAKVGLAQKYDEIGGRLTQYGLLNERDATIESYVTQKTLDGLFLMMAKEEAAIRKNPLGQANRLLRRVFGVLGN